MTYAAPKTDWEPNDDIIDTDFNRIENNTVHLRNSIFTMASHEKNITIPANVYPAQNQYLSLQKMVVYLSASQVLRLIRTSISHSLTFSNFYNLVTIPYLRINSITNWVVDQPVVYEEALYTFILDNVPLVTNTGSTDRWYLIEIFLRVNALVHPETTMDWASWSLRFELQN